MIYEKLITHTHTLIHRSNGRFSGEFD